MPCKWTTPKKAAKPKVEKPTAGDKPKGKGKKEAK